MPAPPSPGLQPRSCLWSTVDTALWISHRTGIGEHFYLASGQLVRLHLLGSCGWECDAVMTVLTPVWMVRIGELKQLDGCPIFDDEGDAHAFGWAVGCN